MRGFGPNRFLAGLLGLGLAFVAGFYPGRAGAVTFKQKRERAQIDRSAKQKESQLEVVQLELKRAKAEFPKRIANPDLAPHASCDETCGERSNCADELTRVRIGRLPTSKKYCVELYAKVKASWESVEAACQGTLRECPFVDESRKHLEEVAGLEEKIEALTKDLTNLRAKREALEQELEDSSETCVDCSPANPFQWRSPSNGELAVNGILGGISAITPTVLGGVSMGLQANAYNNALNAGVQMYGMADNTCRTIGAPCPAPMNPLGFGMPMIGAGMMGMGMGYGGMPGMGMGFGGMPGMMGYGGMPGMMGYGGGMPGMGMGYGGGMPGMMGYGGMPGMGMGMGFGNSGMGLGLNLGLGFGMGMPGMGMGMGMGYGGMPGMGMGYGMPGMMGMNGMSGMPGMLGINGMMNPMNPYQVGGMGGMGQLGAMMNPMYNPMMSIPGMVSPYSPFGYGNPQFNMMGGLSGGMTPMQTQTNLMMAQQQAIQAQQRVMQIGMNGGSYYSNPYSPMGMGQFGTPQFGMGMGMGYGNSGFGGGFGLNAGFSGGFGVPGAMGSGFAGGGLGF